MQNNYNYNNNNMNNKYMGQEEEQIDEIEHSNIGEAENNAKNQEDEQDENYVYEI